MSGNLKVVHWNVGFGADADKIATRLKSLASGDFVCALLEINEKKRDIIKAEFGENVKMAFSLDCRPPKSSDSKARHLGVLLVAGGNVEIEKYGVFGRAIFPDRTLFATLKIGEKVLKFASFHSLTGCSYGSRKSQNFWALSEGIDEFRPDIVTIDANEPEVDHYDIDKMKFWYENGLGAWAFFHTLQKLGLKDSLVVSASTEQKREWEEKIAKKQPLATSLETGKGEGKKHTPRRYDFIFGNFANMSAEYGDLNEARSDSADHSWVKAEICLSSAQKKSEASAEEEPVITNEKKE